MATKQQLQNMLDETINELQKPNAAMQGRRFLQLIHHRANLEMHLRDLENPKPEPEKPTVVIRGESFEDYDPSAELFS